MSDKALHLAPPAKDFGKGMNRTLVFSLILTFFALGQSVRIITKVATNPANVSNVEFIVLLLAIGMFIYTVSVLITYRKNLGPQSARMDYVKKQVIPYLNAKYGVKIASNDSNALKVISGETLFKDKEKRGVFFHGWDEVEAEAANPVGIDMTDTVFLLRKEYQDRDDFFEYPPADGEGGVSFLSAPKQMKAPADGLSLTDEAGVYLWMSQVISKLPAGRSTFESYNGKDAPDPWNIFTVEKDEDGSVSYSNASMKKFAHEFHLLNQQGHNQIGVYTTLSGTGEKYGISALLSDEGIFYYDYPEGEREIENSHGEKITLVSRPEDLYNAGQPKPEDDHEHQRFMFLTKKIINQLPNGKSLLMVANTLNEVGAPVNVEVLLSNDKMNYADDDVNLFALTLQGKIKDEGEAVILTIINHEPDRKAYAIGIFVAPDKYSFIPASDMRESFGFDDSEGETQLIDSLEFFQKNE